jgi:Na+/melibiose symporter-like transporter
MTLFLLAVVIALPVWLRLSLGRDKAVVLMIGTLWWMATSIMLIFAQPDWPRWVFMIIPPLAGIGYAVVDLMPWAMLGEVIDEDELNSGQRREGLYNGLFTFLRKLGGALGVFLVMSILDLVGYQKGAEQSETVRQTIRMLSAFAPVAFLAVAAVLSYSYPLTRAAHAEIAAKLAERELNRA